MQDFTCKSGRRLSSDDVELIQRRALARESIPSIARALGRSYHTVYDVVRRRAGCTATPTSDGRQRYDATTRLRVFKLKRRLDLTNAELAGRFGVSKTTVSKMVLEARMLLAAAVHTAYLTSSEQKVCDRFGLLASEVDELFSFAAERRLPKRLLADLKTLEETWNSL